MATSVQAPEIRNVDSASFFCPHEWLFVVALIVAVFLAYQPAWHGTYVWDDDGHITPHELRSWYGLYRIWFDLDATHQYYPLVHSAFWLQAMFWGDVPLGYHWVNLLLHAAGALMVAWILRRLAVPGAYLAAAIFALHPVQVESVAWITELKNTLSGVFYLGATILYIEFDRLRQKWRYAAAFGLFVLAFLTKTAVVTLPAALLLILWWQHGWLSWRRDVLPLVPFFLVAAVSGLFTAWVERSVGGAVGTRFDFTLSERMLIAGQGFWFYLSKLFWPANLTMMYRRWDIHQAAWWQYLFPASVLALVAVLWLLRRRWRGPLAGVLFFVGTLLPALGVCSLYWFRYSLLADHFQYLASLGIITLVSAGTALALQRRRLWGRPAAYAICLPLLALLAFLTWRQSHMYTDIETFFRTIITRSPTCSMAHDNLGTVLTSRGRFGEAFVLFQKALEIDPDNVEIRNNMGVALGRRGQLNDAIAHYLHALKIAPTDPQTHYNLGNALAKQEKYEEAIAHYRKTLESKPDHELAHINLGGVLRRLGQIDDAVQHYQDALRIVPQDTLASDNLNAALRERDNILSGVARLRNLIRARPRDTALLNDTAWMLATNPNASIRNGNDAVDFARRAVKLSNAQEPAVLGTLAAAYAEAGQFADAVETAQKAIALAAQQNDMAVVESIKAKLLLYKTNTPFREIRASPIQP